MPDDQLPPLAGSPGEAPQAGANTNGAAASPPVATRAISAEPMNMPPIPLSPAPKPTAPPQPAKKEPEVKDTFREVIETIVFVVVLVLMLKTFLAEAFVIPTGSMADTLLGYHHKIVCPQCGYTNLVNASSEADPQDGDPQAVTDCRCENCFYWNRIR